MINSTIYSNEIKDYINRYSRNKIIIHKESFLDIPSIDLGIILSYKLYGLTNESRISLIANKEIDEIFTSHIFTHEDYGKCISLKNIGILFEKELKIDFLKLLEKYSNNNNLFIHWEGAIDVNSLYFLTKEKGIKININELSHIII